VHFTWFFRMDPQIAHVYGSASWVAVRYRRSIDALRASGDDVGLHVHPWRWDARGRAWIENFDDQPWIEHCVRCGFEAFEQSMGTPCRTFRFGDRFMNDETLGLLERLGVRVDLTAEPGLNGGDLPEPFTGALPDYTRVPRQPYRPSRADFASPGLGDPRDLWMVPLSAGSVDAPRLGVDRRRATASWIITRHGQARTGLIVADPNPVPVDGPGHGGVTRLSWTASGATLVEVRVDAPDGALLARSGGAGATTTGPWVQNGMVFYLQDASDGRGSSPDDTLATVRMGVISNPTGAHMTLNLAFDPLIVRSIADALLGTLARPYLACVTRTDVGIRPRCRANFEATFDFLASHPLRERFVFEGPLQMLRRDYETEAGRESG
jgi:hypothetical protein